MRLSEALGLAEIHGISPAGRAKEQIRAELQSLIQQAVLDGRVSTQEELDEMHGALRMALDALKMVPYEVWTGGKVRAARRRSTQ